MINEKMIERLREFAKRIESYPEIETAWIDDWGRYTSFQFGITVRNTKPSSTNTVKAIIRRVLQNGIEFDSISVDLTNYNSPAQTGRDFWMFSGDIID